MANSGRKLLSPFDMRRLKLTFAVVIFYGTVAVHGVSFEEDVRITMEQKYAIDKLRRRVAPYITEDFMDDNLYLTKWLRSVDFDIGRAEQRLMENIRWRKEKKISNIMTEDFSDVAEEYPYSSSGVDKEGRPLFVGFAGEWDLRSAVVTGKVPRVLRYLDQGMEELRLKIRKFQLEGKNVTQAVLVVDLSSFSLVTHACVQCLIAIVDFLHSYEGHYTGMAHKVFFTNAPPTVQMALEVIRANLSQLSRDAITVFGFNRRHFSSVLLEHIDPKYLPVELGGKLVRN